MKKRIMPLLVTLLFVISCTASTALAANGRAITGRPTLRIDGTTAYCGVTYRSGNSDTQISVTLTLKQGSTIIDSWSGSGKGMVIISETSTVELGKTYDLVLESTVDGIVQPEVVVTVYS